MVKKAVLALAAETVDASASRQEPALLQQMFS